MAREQFSPKDGLPSVLASQIEIASLFIKSDPVARNEAVDRLDYMPPEERLSYMLSSLTTYGRVVTMLLAEQLDVGVEDVQQYIIDRAHEDHS